MHKSINSPKRSEGRAILIENYYLASAWCKFSFTIRSPLANAKTYLLLVFSYRKFKRAPNLGALFWLLGNIFCAVLHLSCRYKNSRGTDASLVLNFFRGRRA
mgnify:CR=1 FL=1